MICHSTLFLDQLVLSTDVLELLLANLEGYSCYCLSKRYVVDNNKVIGDNNMFFGENNEVVGDQNEVVQQ